MIDSRPHGIPTAAELAEALREFLEREVMTVQDPRLAFAGRVARNVAAMLARELELWPGHTAADAERLAALGFAGDEELCRAIRDGSVSDTNPELISALFSRAVERLRIVNPRYLRPEDS